MAILWPRASSRKSRSSKAFSCCGAAYRSAGKTGRLPERANQHSVELSRANELLTERQLGQASVRIRGRKDAELNDDTAKSCSEEKENKAVIPRLFNCSIK
jgi:topoisomerase IA-like protein